jgi:hypothetical protein
LDVPALDELAKLKEDLTRQQVDLILVRVHDDVLDLLEISGVAGQIGAGFFAHSLTEGALIYLELEPDFTPVEIEHILQSTPHLKELFDIAGLYADDEEKVRLAKARRRFQTVMENMKAAGS